MNTREQTEDLKAFEQRLTECVSYIDSTSTKWRVLLVMVLLFLFASIWNLWRDENSYNTYTELVWAHKGLSLCLIVLAILCLSGVMQRSRAANIITHRCRNVLHNYNMSCDEQGKLILKRPPR